MSETPLAVQNPLELYRTSETLTAEDFIALFDGQILAIRIPDFCTQEACSLISSRLIHHSERGYYPHVPSISRVMMAFYEGHSDAEKREQYYKQAIKSTLEFRRISWPYLSPIDHIHLTIEDMWPLGAVRENIEGSRMAFGLAQLFAPGACALPHQDFLRLDQPSNPRAQSLIAQIGAFVYLQPALEGGELELWHEHYDPVAFEEYKNKDTYGLDYLKLPSPALTITPLIGDLVIASSKKVHAVRMVKKGTRIAASCFIGFRGIQEPLTYWS